MNLPQDYTILHSLLDRPIAFHRVFVTISGSVLAGLMLSQGYYWTPRGESGDGWFYKTQSEWEKETGMSRTEQETARKRLRDVKAADGTPIWEEDRRGVPAKMYYRVNVPALFEVIFGQSIEIAIKNVDNLQSSMQDSRNLDSNNPAHLSAESPQSFYITENTTENSGSKVRPPSGRKAKEPTTGTRKKYDLDHPEYRDL